jgi:iron(III) transport system permease protein
VSLRAIGRAKRRNPIIGVGAGPAISAGIPDAPDTRAVAAQDVLARRELAKR